MLHAQEAYAEQSNDTDFLISRHLQRPNCWYGQRKNGEIGNNMQKRVQQTDILIRETPALDARIPYCLERYALDEKGHQNPGVAYNDGREDGVADFAHVSTGEDAHV